MTKEEMKRECQNCGTLFNGTIRAKFCSSKCRLAFHRNNETQLHETVNKPNDETQRETVLTKTDGLFQQDAIDRNLGENWLTFGEIVRNPNCRSCGKPFKTRLSLLMYCSPKCKNEAFVPPKSA